MIYVNYYIYDIFKCDHFVYAQAETDTNSIKTAFKALKKNNATVFIDVDDDTQTRYEFKYPYSDSDILEKVTLSHVKNFKPDESDPVLIDYKTALKQELKKVR